MAKSTQLYDQGVTTFQLFASREVPGLRREFIQAVTEESPEFLPDAPTHVIGGFGALGNPSSFHHPFFRKIRERMYSQTITLFYNYYKNYAKNPIWESEAEDAEEVHIQFLMDRVSWRKPGTSVAVESWHRDNSLASMINPGDQVFGMMLNLSEAAVNFSCVPGTHKTALAWNPGNFDKISQEEIEREDYEARKKVFSIRPGEMIIFFQHIVHEIAKPKGKLKAPEFRVYCGVRLSVGPSEFYSPAQIDEWIKTQAVPTIKSGQIPDVFTKMHGVCFKNKPFTVCEGEKMTLTEWLGRTYKFHEKISKRVHPSLKTLELPLHPAYTKKEKDILLPQPLKQKAIASKKN